MTSDIARPPRFPDAVAPLLPERAFVIQFRAPDACGDDQFVGRAEHIASGAEYDDGGFVLPPGSTTKNVP